MRGERARVLHVEARERGRGEKDGQGELRFQGTRFWTQEGESAQRAPPYGPQETWRINAHLGDPAMIPAVRAPALRPRDLRPRCPPGLLRRAARPPPAAVADPPARPRVGAHRARLDRRRG